MFSNMSNLFTKMLLLATIATVAMMGMMVPSVEGAEVVAAWAGEPLMQNPVTRFIDAAQSVGTGGGSGDPMTRLTTVKGTAIIDGQMGLIGRGFVSW